MNGEYYTTIGMDVSDRKTQVCVMAKVGATPRIVMETTIPTTKDGLAKFLSTQDRDTPVAFETGTSPPPTKPLRIRRRSRITSSIPGSA